MIQEVINRNALVNLLLRAGFNCYLPVVDQGIDLVAHREADNTTRLVQLKSRWTVCHKYEGRSIWVAWPEGGAFFLAPHDEMVDFAVEVGWATSRSWAEDGIYHRAGMSAAMLARFSRYRIE